MAKSRSRHEARTPILEWVTAAVGLLCVLTALGVVAASALQPRTPPSLDARIVSVANTPRGFTAEIEVINSGSVTASGVEIEGQLNEETSTTTLDYVAGGGRELASLAFSKDPRQGDFNLAVRAWTEP